MDFEGFAVVARLFSGIENVFLRISECEVDGRMSIHFSPLLPPRRINSSWPLVREREAIANSRRAVYNVARYGIQLFLRPLVIVDRFLSYFT